MAKIKISDVNKKHLKIICWLVGSWLVALGLAYIRKDPRLAGLAPVLNFVGYVIYLELKKEGYREALK